MKKIFLLKYSCTFFFICFLQLLSNAQQIAAPARTNKGWGYIRPDLSWLIEPKFLSYWGDNYYLKDNENQVYAICEFHDGMVAYRKYNGDWGFYNNEGVEIVPAKYNAVKDFNESVAAVLLDNLWGYINKKGDWVIQPQFTDAKSFSNGLAAVEQNKKWGYIDPSGKIVIPFSYDNAKKFTASYAPVEVEGKWGYIDVNGTWLVEPEFKNAFSFCEGMASVFKKGNYGFIDLSGKLVIPCVYPKAMAFKQGVSRVKTHFWFFIDKTGKPICVNQFLNAEDFQDSVAMVRTAIGWGYINLDCSWTVPPTIEMQGAKDFYYGIGLVRLKTDWKFIDKRGNKLFDSLVFDKAENFSGGYGRIKVGNNWGVINKEGRLMGTPALERIYPFIDINRGTKSEQEPAESQQEEN